MLVVQLLGPLRVLRDGAEVDLGSPARRVVFGLLALSVGQPVPRQELVDALWGGAPPASAANVLQTHLKHLRQALEPGRPARAPSAVLPAAGEGYALRLPGGEIDLLQFRALVEAADQAQRDGDLAGLAGGLGEALALRRGPPLADIPTLAGHPRVAGLVAELRHVLGRYGDAMIAAGQAAAALPALVADAVAHPLDESTQTRLIRAYQAAGQRGQAFGVYDATRRRLAGELGLDPGPELVAGYQQLLRDPPDPPAARPAQPRPTAAPQQLPAGVVELVGRDGELRALDADLAGPQPVIRLISGTAGVGKTALALHWAQRVRAEFPDGQLYVDLRGYDPEQPMLPAEALGRFLEALGADGALPLDPDLRAARFRTAIAGRRLLVVLDNAASHAQLRPLLPGGPGAMVIVTSRDSLGGLVALHAARRLDLGPLTEPDAVRLLGGLIGPRVAAEPAAASTLAELCARLPLALRVAAEYAVSWPEQPLADLVTDLTDRQRRLDLLDTGDARAAVREVISWSYHRLDPAAARAFRWLGLHPGPAFDGYALAALAGLELRPARRLLERLSRASLLQPAGRHRYGWHDLLRAYAAELAHTEESEVDCRAATGRLFDYYLAGTAAAARTLYPSQRGHLPDPPAAGIPPLATPAAAGAWLDAELANLSAACGHAAQHGWPEHAIGLAAHLHRYLEGGHHTDALAIYEAALTAARQAGDRRGEAHLRTNLGDIYRLLGQYQPATEQHHRALGLHRRTGDRSGQARTLSDLGIVAERCGSHSAAVRRYRHALRLYRELGDRYGEAAVLVNLGNVYSGQSRYAAAVEALGEAREIFGAIGERAGQAAALANLGEVYTTLRRYRQAADRLRDALAVFREIGHRDGEAAVLANLGLVDTRLGRTAEAIDFFQAALAIFRSTGHRYGQASAHNGLAEALAALGRTDQALAQHNQALAIASETGDRDEQVRAGKAIEQLTGAASASLQTPTSVR